MRWILIVVFAKLKSNEAASVLYELRLKRAEYLCKKNVEF